MTLWTSIMSKPKRAKQWPPIYKVKHRSGQVGFQVDLGTVEGKRKRVAFPSRPEAQTYAEQCRVAKANEGMAAFTLPTDIRLDAAKAHQFLAPHGVTILEAAKYYQKHVLAYKTAPPVREIVQRYIADSTSRNLRPRTIGDLKHRLNSFADDFGDARLSDITLDELKEWVQDEQWEMRTRVNFLTKISQLYGYALRRKWVDSNLTELIDRPTVDECKPEIFTVEQAEQLLTHAHRFDLLPFIALGLFAGLRSAEMGRLDAKDINFLEKTIRIQADVAKKRAHRNVDMQDALMAWLEPCKTNLQQGGAILDQNKFRKNKELLLEAAGIDNWPSNGLRHSFASYHLAKFCNSDNTAYQMGHRSTEILHRHYKALVAKSEAERFWNIRPALACPPEHSNHNSEEIASVLDSQGTITV
jgi:integrase